MQQDLRVGGGVEIALLPEKQMVDDHRRRLVDLLRKLPEFIRHDEHEGRHDHAEGHNQQVGRKNAEHTACPELAEGEAASLKGPEYLRQDQEAGDNEKNVDA